MYFNPRPTKQLFVSVVMTIVNSNLVLDLCLSLKDTTSRLVSAECGWLDNLCSVFCHCLLYYTELINYRSQRKAICSQITCRGFDFQPAVLDLGAVIEAR